MKCILCVDDEPDVLNLITKMLQHFGYEVESEVESDKALKLFKADINKFDLIVIDFMMQDMNGLEFINKIHDLNPRIPAIILTGLSSDEIFNEYPNKSSKDSKDSNGCNGCNQIVIVQKPVKLKEFKQIVKNVLDGKK